MINGHERYRKAGFMPKKKNPVRLTAPGSLNRKDPGSLGSDLTYLEAGAALPPCILETVASKGL